MLFGSPPESSPRHGQALPPAPRSDAPGPCHEESRPRSGMAGEGADHPNLTPDHLRRSSQEKNAPRADGSDRRGPGRTGARGGLGVERSGRGWEFAPEHHRDCPRARAPASPHRAPCLQVDLALVAGCDRCPLALSADLQQAPARMAVRGVRPGSRGQE